MTYNLENPYRIASIFYMQIWYIGERGAGNQDRPILIIEILAYRLGAKVGPVWLLYSRETQVFGNIMFSSAW